MKMSLFLICLHFWQSFSVSISCSKPQWSYLGESISIIKVLNPPSGKYAIIGNTDPEVYLSYSPDKGEWKNKLGFFSLESYDSQKNYIYLNNSGVWYFAVCGFEQSLTYYDVKYNISDYNYTCFRECKGYNGKCVSGRCSCSNGYFGYDCSLGYQVVSDGYDQTFSATGYSLTYFTDNTIKGFQIENDKNDIQIFYSNSNSFPSFFNYNVTKHGDELPGTVSNFTVFCTNPVSCVFRINASAGTSKSLPIGAIIGALVSFGILIIVCLIGGVIYYRRVRRLKLENQGIKREKLDDYAPVFKYVQIQESDTCSICLNDFKGDDDLRKIKKCSHYFHQECISEWLTQKPNCPVCKSVLV